MIMVYREWYDSPVVGAMFAKAVIALAPIVAVCVVRAWKATVAKTKEAAKKAPDVAFSTAAKSVAGVIKGYKTFENEVKKNLNK